MRFTVHKLLALAFVVPVAALAAVPEPAEFVVGVLPTYWPAKALVVGLERAHWSEVVPYLAVGTAYAAALLYGLARRFGSRLT
ncbi:hypothetical protein [Halorussus sp. AFM4]|uniref:hypothetical protein n=1 Tax=Halorussus sp. AFM4 TaxID=3421651 RepID=UPI003EBA8FA6